MDPATLSAITPFAGVQARRELPELANFHNANGNAVSFFFSLQSIPDKSHHLEVTLVRDLVRQQHHRFNLRNLPDLAEDLEAVLTLAEEVRDAPRYWTIFYACRGQRLGRKFELPAPKAIRRLHVGERFLLAPMFWALNFCTPYGVLLFERGRARIFVVGGFHIQEFHGRLPKENITLHVRASRSESEKHQEQHMHLHVREYCRELAGKLRLFLAQEKLQHVAVGCRDDLWGETKPEFAEFNKGALIGRFVLSAYDMPTADVREATYPIFAEHRRRSGAALLDRIRNDAAHGAVGVNAVLERLVEGRVLKLMLVKPVDGVVSECDQCERLQPDTDGPCMFCDNRSLHSLEAEEGLIRQAVLTDADIFIFDEGEIPEFTGAAALLRF
jgi:hypothetical protein